MESKITFKVDWGYDPDKKSGLTIKGDFCVSSEEIPVPLYMAILKAMLQVEDLLNGEGQRTEAHVPHPGETKTSPGESMEEKGALREEIIDLGLEMEDGTPAGLKRIIKTGPMAAPDPQPTEDAAETWDRQRIADLEEERNGKNGRTILPPPRRNQ